MLRAIVSRKSSRLAERLAAMCGHYLLDTLPTNAERPRHYVIGAWPLSISHSDNLQSPSRPLL